MNKLGKIDEELKKAIKARDQLCLNTLRLLKTALKNKQVELKRSLAETEMLQVVNTLVKQRRESIEQFEKGGRQDLVDAESKELEILLSYLPPPISEVEILKFIDEAISESGASGPSDMGKVMKIVMAKVSGRADGKFVNSLVAKKLQPKG